MLVLQGSAFAESNYTVDYSTYLGGDVVDEARDVYVDESGYIYVTGSTHVNGSKDVFVARFNTSRKIIYYTTFGGAGDDWGHRIIADADGYAYVAGEISSAGVEAKDAFVARIDPLGKIEMIRHIGGSKYDVAKGIAMDGSGTLYVSGYTISEDLQATDDAYQKINKGGYDAFIAKLDRTLTVTYLSYLGGSWDDYCQGLALDNNGNIYIAGYTYSDDFPVTFDAVSQYKRGTNDIFISRFTPQMSFDYSTYLGGSGQDMCHAITSYGGLIYIAGKTNSTDFPVTPVTAYQRTKKGLSDGFVVAFDGEDVTYSTYFGGSGDDAIYGITADKYGNLYLTGTTSSSDFPLTEGAFDRSLNGVDAFITKFSIPRSVLYSSYLGGIEADHGYAVAVDPYQNVYVAGKTWSNNFPVTSDAIKMKLTGLSDGFLTRFTPFFISNLSVTPVNGTAPLSITVNGKITNYGDASGWYRLGLYVNGYEVLWQWIEVASKATRDFSFEYLLRNSRTYSVTVNNFQPFTVRAFSGPLIIPENLTVLPRAGTEPLRVNVTADIVNYGDLPDTYTAGLYVDGILVDSKSVTVDAKSRVRVSFNSTLAAGVHEITINDLEPLTVNVMEGEKFLVDGFRLTPESGLAPLNVMVTANITNIDSKTRSYTAIIYVNGVDVHEQTFDVPAGSTVPFSAMITLPESGIYTIALNNATSGTVRALSAASFTLTNVTVTPLEGKSPLNVTVNATVRNQGDLPGDFTVTVYLDGVAWDSRTVTVPGRSSVKVSIKNQIIVPGEYNLRVNSGEEVKIRVLDPDPVFGGFSVTPVTGVGALNVTALLNVTNPYDMVIGFTARLHVNNQTVQENTVSLNPGETKEISMKTTLLPGNYSVGINGFTGNVRVLKPANITASDLTVTPTSGFSPLDLAASAKLRNTGEVDGEYIATLYINGAAVDTRTVTVPAGGTSQVRFNHTLNAPGTYLAGIGALAPVTVRVLNEPLVSNLNVTPASGVSPLIFNVTARISTAETGSGNYTARLYIDGVNVQNKTVQLTGPGASTVLFRVELSDPGIHDVTVNDLAPVTVRVLRPATFVVDNLLVSPHEGVLPLTIEASARISNVGDVPGNYTARLYIDGVPVASRTVNVAAGGETTVTFRYPITQRGNHTVTVDTLPAANVNALKPATLEIGFINVTPSSAVGSATVEVEAEIQNTGDVEGDFTVPVYLNGNLIGTYTVKVGPHEGAVLRFQRYISSPGTYTFSINNLKTATVYVNPPKRTYRFTFKNTGSYTATVTYYVTVYSSGGSKLAYKTYRFTLKPRGSYTATIGYYPYNARIVTTRKIYNPSRYTRTIRLSETFRADTLSATLSHTKTIRGYSYVYISRTFRAVDMRITVT
ncbi:SBBP repeat-containing protein [Methanothermobacter marburgensis]|uniref:Predicted cell surface glycoprotein n=1 Tax=Methanothermobacter marburgensis (strain ATCC BAA-927 / DSM 2133 / JCM 14651 / NBRC 100331 / OCM 82 / Marburg) TaxID=79929 RepID=D9PU10_METTM|nr:SBBP repeat-containing protein [Methanothermobacter marburgensis]ADL57708.1 predicted cell surface glycoprotein [Methanothermobacter marburgensis str. Marburg]WBF09935.1 SBBP repeat-containing protein [Methanothermobacter marburgensis]